MRASIRLCAHWTFDFIRIMSIRGGGLGVSKLSSSNLFVQSYPFARRMARMLPASKSPTAVAAMINIHSIAESTAGFV